MKRNDLFTKLLAIGGTILVWLPLLFPILLAVMAYSSYGALFFDYLMPAELFPLALAGAALLLCTILSYSAYTDGDAAAIGWRGPP